MHFLSKESLTALACVVGGVSVALTVGRIIQNRKSKNTAARYADYLNGAAAASLVALLTAQCYYLPLHYKIADWSMGKLVFITKADMKLFYVVQFANLLLFWVVLYLVKLSFLMLYRALFRISSAFRKAWWAVLAFTVISFLVDMLGALWLCGPPAGLFDPAACATNTALVMGLRMSAVAAFFNIASDLAIMGLGLGMVRGLQISTAKKVGLGAVFSLAAIDVAIDIARIVATFMDGWSLAYDLLEPALAVGVCALPMYGRVGTELSRWMKSRWPRGFGIYASSKLASPFRRSPANSQEDGRDRGRLVSPRPWFGSRPGSLEDTDTLVASSISSGEKIQCETHVEISRRVGDVGEYYLPEMRFSAFGKWLDRPYEAWLV